MANPGGNYPGRQIFVGGLKSGLPAFAYFGSGRSKDSQERYAAPFDDRENAIRIKPIDPRKPFDPFLHYQAVRIDPETGLVVVSNSQAPQDPLFEAYKFMPDEEKGSGTFLMSLMGIIGPEYDRRDKPTQRIVTVIVPLHKDLVVAHMGITTAQRYRDAIVKTTSLDIPGDLAFVQTYNGDVDYKPFNTWLLHAEETIYETSATTAQELADELYEISDYIDPKYGQLRVWCVAGVRNGNGPGGWDIKRRNRHQVE